MEKSNSDVLSELQLPSQADEVADQIRAWIILADIEAEQNEERRKVKQTWTRRWAGLFIPDVELDYGRNPWHQFKGALDAAAEIDDKVQAGLLLVELIAFTPYIPLKSGEVDSVKEKDFFGALKKVKLDPVVRQEVLGNLAIATGFDRGYPVYLEKMFNKALTTIQGNWTKTVAYVTGGAFMLAFAGAASAAGMGAAVGAAMGLHGAAAMAAGLAFLGGGSLASGGLGMAGGFAVLRFSTDDLGSGVSLREVTQGLTKAAALNEGAKMRVVLDEIVRHHGGDQRLHKEVLRRQRRLLADIADQVDDLSLELAREKAAGEPDKARIKQLKERIGELDGVSHFIEQSVKVGRQSYIDHCLAGVPGH